MDAQEIYLMLQKTEKFVRDGCLAIIRDEWKAPKKFLLSPCSVCSALAIMALLTKPKDYTAIVNKGLKFLEASRQPDGGWGRHLLQLQTNKPPGFVKRHSAVVNWVLQRKILKRSLL